MKILIIDDSAFSRELIFKELVALGFNEKEIYQADSGAAAIRKINSDSFDLFLVDLVMPGIDGIRVVKEIRDGQPDARVVVCSGQLCQEALQTLVGMGVHDFLGKPFTQERFRQAIVQNIASVFAGRRTAPLV